MHPQSRWGGREGKTKLSQGMGRAHGWAAETAALAQAGVQGVQGVQRWHAADATPATSAAVQKHSSTRLPWLRYVAPFSRRNRERRAARPRWSVTWPAATASCSCRSGSRTGGGSAASEVFFCAAAPGGGASLLATTAARASQGGVRGLYSRPGSSISRRKGSAGGSGAASRCPCQSTAPGRAAAAAAPLPGPWLWTFGYPSNRRPWVTCRLPAPPAQQKQQPAQTSEQGGYCNQGWVGLGAGGGRHDCSTP